MKTAQTTAEWARENEIFYIVKGSIFDWEKVAEVAEYSIGKTSYYDFVMDSAEETTTPRGVAKKLHIREVGYERERNVFYSQYEVWTWGWRGQHPKLIESFETESEAEAHIFDLTEEYDFGKDCSRDTRYYSTLEEAMEQVVEFLAEDWRVDVEVARHLARKHQRLAELRAEREEAEKAARPKQAEEDNKRVSKLAAVYAEMIEPQAEGFKETCARLGEAIGEKIEGAVFYKAVKMVRERYVK